MSSFYLDVLKDRLYCDKSDSRERRSARTVIYEILITITKLYAPILPFTTEEIWGFIPSIEGGYEKSIHLSRFPLVKTPYIDYKLADRWEKLLKVRGEVNQALEEARSKRQIGSSLEAEVLITTQGKQFELLNEYGSYLPTLFIVSRVRIEEEVGEEANEIKVFVKNAPGKKCERCWNYSAMVGKNPDHPTICERCWEVLA